MSKTDKEKGEMSVMSDIGRSFVFGERLYFLWLEYEEGKTREARYIRAIDKLESHIHVIERGGTGRGVADARHQIGYADRAVENFSELDPFLKVLKKRLRPLLEAQGLLWKREYD